MDEQTPVTYTLPDRNAWLRERLRNLYCACAHAIDEGHEPEKAWVEEINDLHKTVFGGGAIIGPKQGPKSLRQLAPPSVIKGPYTHPDIQRGDMPRTTGIHEGRYGCGNSTITEYLTGR